MTAPMNGPKIEKPVLKTSVGLYFEIKRRFKMSSNENGERKRVKDDSQFRKDYEEMVKMIPNGRGALVIICSSDGEVESREFLKSDGSLRIKFKSTIKLKDGVSMSRYQYYKSMLYEGVFSGIKVQMIS